MPVGGASGRRRQQEPEESVYALGQIVGPGMTAQPRIRAFSAAPTAQAPPPNATPTGGAAAAGGHHPRLRMHADSSQVQHLLNPVQGPRDAQVRAGIKPLDHARSNLHAVREASQLNALRRAAAEAHERQYPGGTPAYHRVGSAPSHRPPTLSAPLAPNGRNFMQENKLGAGAPARPAKAVIKEDELKYLHKQDYGRVPSYLLERKIELAAQHEAEERMKEQALIPPGMRLLPDEERLETLGILSRNKEEVEKAIQGLPLRIETPSAIRRKEDLERRLAEIEDATKIFQRPKVLVHS